MNALEKLVKARVALLLRHRFFGRLALKLKLVADESVGTAAVDGISFFYSPSFILSLTHAQIMGLIAHEVLHCGLGHPMRIGKRDFVQFNEAGDFAINLSVLEAGLELPPDGLVDQQFANMAAEEIYAKRGRGKNPPGNQPNGNPGQQQQQPNNIGGCGTFRAPTTGSLKLPVPKADLDQLAREWQVAVIQAANMAKKAGELSSGLQQIVDNVKTPIINPREALKRFLTAVAAEDYSWFPPNKRHIANGLYLPSLRSEKLGTLAFLIDTSASMDVDALQQALAELNAIVDELQPDLVYVLEADMRVHECNVYDSNTYPIESKTLSGRGGTRFAPTFAYLAEHEITPDCAIYFSDMECDDFGDEPSFPVLWLSTNKTFAPWGEVLKII